ncbi:gamma-glutamyltransferase family protein [Nocardia seriolae]|uniref:gamma-glutamyltransferase family protein n=1 Tax=Nocardia seriolae TaxID=37332 RepID=UPI00051A1552|nr:gamma-glutamyltransferase family protein [Nocardia seriolae]MTJ62874.1 gamma-glutamyltransferase [Nocardia seriolae]MTJ73433.1 gamma-glutamyltransferase [Nocardia seriolae]MTJ87908.1 gamma-glutamyltransferase [Nocardia seriolae]MTK31899.1 gamma-glutamyltransferase [Nocardia seriolae]MTK40809.1 gamma-glutamyltransferase [Nocardia seriolae]
MRRSRRTAGGAAALLLLAGLLTACSSSANHTASCTVSANGTPVTSGVPTGPTGTNLALRPEIATGYRTGMTPVRTGDFAVSTANPVATEAACKVLRDGGTAADALIVAQTVLNLVEPQASGIGGGAFLMYYDATTRSVDAYDGRETAPAAATEDYLRYISAADHTVPQPNARASGRSIGVPGVLRLLEQAHDEHGKQSWKDLFTPAIDLADQGFEISPRMAGQIAASKADLARDDNAKAYFLLTDGSPKTSGTTLTNPAFGKTLSAIATDGANAFYTGAIAADIVDNTALTSGGRTPGLLALADLQSYQAKKRTAVCSPYRNHEICGMPNPSSGGITVEAALGILSNFDLASMKPTDAAGDGNTARDGGRPTAAAVHLIAEAERLAYADRDKYIADADFVPLPGNSPQTLLDPTYLKQRAGLIDPNKSMGTAKPGDFGPVPIGNGPQQPEHGTSHVSIVDEYGNAAAMTTTVESAFGSFHFVDGFILNNQLTDFSAEPLDKDGNPIANRLDPGKRPRSSMAPTLVFDRNPDGTRGQLSHVTGSPGGAVIIQFVVKTLVGMLDWGLNPQQAVSMIDFGANNTPTTNLGGEHPAVNAADKGDHDPLVLALRQQGDQVSVAPQSSGLSALARDGDGWIGSADPRREGAVLGSPR